MAEKTRKIDELTYFNAICCLGVIGIHILSYAITNCAKPSFASAVVFFPSKIAAFVVPAFLFSGAMKMSAGFTDEHETAGSYFRYIGNRFKKIVLPYVFWATVYYAVLILIGYMTFSVSDFIKSLFLGTLSSQFYYVVITVQFYLLRPLWKLMTDHIPACVGIISANLVTLFSLQTSAVFELCGGEFLYADRIFTSYLVFWVAGLYAGKYQDAFLGIMEKKRRWLPIAAIGAGAFITVSYIQFSRPIWLFNLDYFKIYSDLLMILILFAVCSSIAQAKNKLGALLRRVLAFIHSASYSVFLSHCLVLILTKYYLVRSGYTRISIVTVLCALTCTVLPFTLYALKTFLIRRIRKTDK